MKRIKSKISQFAGRTRLSHRADRIKEGKSKGIHEAIGRVVMVNYESDTINEYRKFKPKYAKMLEHSTAIVTKCNSCKMPFVIERFKHGGRCKPCYAGIQSTYPKKLQKIIDKLFEERYNVINEGVVITKIKP